METRCSILAWRILMDKGAWRATVHGGRKKSWRDLVHTHRLTDPGMGTFRKELSKAC